jgi:hypothetical protein
MKDPVLWVFVLALALVGAGVYYFQYAPDRLEPVPSPVPEATPAVEDAVEAPAVRYPIPETPRAPPAAEPGSAPEAAAPPVAEPALPPLDDSDALLHGELVRLFAGQRIGDQLNLDRIVRRFVVSLDNLPGAKLPRKQLSVRPVPGRFEVSGEGDTLYMSPGNFARYTAFVQLAESIDTEQFVSLYVRVYPLFQQAYEELGYPSAYFNDRLVDVIDHLLEAPDIDGPVRLVRPKVLYQFADPQLEALSAGQKVLIRVGPDNAARLKTKLRELRTALSQVSRSGQQ